MKVNCSKALHTCKSAITRVDVVRKLCTHFIGEEHTTFHRKCVGTIIMIVGVGIAKGGSVLPYEIIHFTTETIGFLIHSIGGIPFVDSFISYVSKSSENQPIINK